jgi:hypothetical protein
MVSRTSVEINVNSTFVKKVPTVITAYLIEKTNSKILIRSISKNSDVPFCDSFMLEFEMLVVGPDKPNAGCCIVRQTMQIIWLKFCMMKSVIRGQTESETRAAYQ